MKNAIKQDWTYILRWAKKAKAVNHLGGKCYKCGNSDVFQLEFHHRDAGDKENNLAALMLLRWSTVLCEIEKCDLLCRNCHQEIHLNLDSRQRVFRNKLLQMKGISKCEDCGYDGPCLDFHHVSGTKDFTIAYVIRGNTPLMSLETLITEMDKCVVLCNNCHEKKHRDYARFERFKNAIDEKIQNYTEHHRVDKEIVKEMKLKGMGVCKIAKELKINRSTISYVFNKV